MRVSIFGLGYVGVVTAACLARDGYQVIGVDVNPEQVALVAKGEYPISEPGLAELLRQGVESGKIEATTDVQAAVIGTEISLISVGTPPLERGEPDLSYVIDVCKKIAVAVQQQGVPHVVVLRATVPPGTLERCQDLMKRLAGEGLIHCAFNPEFLREGSAIEDYDCPPYTIIGSESAVAKQAVAQLYARVQAPMVFVKPAVAEIVKYFANNWHITNVNFANEIGKIAKAFGVDGREVMNLIVQDQKWNLSPAYMHPGFAYGDSCLPKDLGEPVYYTHSRDVFIPLLNTIPVTNDLQIELALQEILCSQVRRITILGFAFKASTDDLRDSPTVPLVKRLLGKGYQVKIYDPTVFEACLMGENMTCIQQHLPNFPDLLVAKYQEILEGAELAIVTYKTSEFEQILLSASPQIKILDLAGIFTKKPEKQADESLAQ